MTVQGGYRRRTAPVDWPSPGLVRSALRWRTEISVLAAVIVASQALTAGTSHTTTLVRTLVAGSVLTLQRETRKWLVDHAHCLLTRHLLYTALEEVQAEIGADRLPLVLRVKPVAAGEQAFLWCRGGISAYALQVRDNQLAAACWAREVRVFVSPRWPSLTILEIVRPAAQPPPPQPQPQAGAAAGAAAGAGAGASTSASRQ